VLETGCISILDVSEAGCISIDVSETGCIFIDVSETGCISILDVSETILILV
jgi:hypothetical protein